MHKKPVMQRFLVSVIWENHITEVLFGLSATLIVPYRCESPPVPAVRNRLLQVQQRQLQNSHLVVHEQHGGGEASQAESQQSRPPSAQFVPYVRTREVYCLQPEAPLSQHPQLHGTETLQGQEKRYSHFHGTAALLAISYLLFTELCSDLSRSQQCTENQIMFGIKNNKAENQQKNSIINLLFVCLSWSMTALPCISI